jgi:hypothetical protein
MARCTPYNIMWSSLQNTTQKTEDCATRTPQQPCVHDISLNIELSTVSMGDNSLIFIISIFRLFFGRWMDNKVDANIVQMFLQIIHDLYQNNKIIKGGTLSMWNLEYMIPCHAIGFRMWNIYFRSKILWNYYRKKACRIWIKVILIKVIIQLYF